MFSEAQQNQHHPTVQPADGYEDRKIQRALCTLRLLSEVTITLFVAGVVVPSFLRSGMATSHAAVGSVHTLTMGGVPFSYTLHSLGAAVLGGLVGLLAALAIEFRATLAKAAGNFLTFWHADWKSFLSGQSGRPSFDGKQSLA